MLHCNKFIKDNCWISSKMYESSTISDNTFLMTHVARSPPFYIRFSLDLVYILWFNDDIANFHLDPDDFGAVDYSLWRYLGNELLLKSIHGDWLHCKPQNVERRTVFPNINSVKSTTVTKFQCGHVKNLAGKSKCSVDTLPKTITWTENGPLLDESSIIKWLSRSKCRINSSFDTTAMLFIR